MASHASRPAARYLAAALLVGGAAVGWGVGVVGREFAVVLPAAVAGVVVLFRPVWGLIGVVFLIPFEAMLLFGGANTATKLLAVFVAGAWFLAKLLRRESWERVLDSRVVGATAVFLAYCFASLLWRETGAGLPSALTRMVMLVGLGLLALDLVRTWSEARWIARALVVGGTVGAVLTLLQHTGGAVRRAGQAIAGGVNATALVLLTVVPFAFVLLRAERSRLWRLLGVAYVGLGTTAVALTFSRMGMLALAAVLAVEVWTTFRVRRGRREVVALLGLGAVVFFSVVPLRTLAERIETIGPYVEETLDASRQGVVDRSGRGYHIAVAFHIFRDHPAVGAGFGSYGELFLRYQHEVAGAGGQLYHSPRSSHGNFWGFLADLGLLGTVLWLSLLVFVALELRAAWRRLAAGGDPFPSAFVRAVGLVFLIQCLYGAYAEMHLEKLFWMVVGLSVALRHVAAESRPDERPAVREARAR